jgi:hypothetical protein
MEERTKRQGPAVKVYLTGLPGVGKTTLARGLESLEPTSAMLSSGISDSKAINMRQLLKWHGYGGQDSLRDLQTYHAAQRQANKAEQILGALEILGPGVWTVDSIRHPQDLAIVGQNPNLYGLVLGLQAPDAQSREQFLADSHDEKHFHVLDDMASQGHDPDDPSIVASARQRTWELAMREAEGIQRCLKAADYIIDASRKPDAVLAEATELITEYAEGQCAVYGLLAVAQRR